MNSANIPDYIALCPGRTLFVSDLDGTLLNDSSLVSPRSAALLNEAIDAGALFSVATARTPSTVAPLLADVNLKFPAVVMTGVSLWNPVTGLYSDTHFMAPDIPRRIADIYERHGLSAFIYTLDNHKIHIYHRGPVSDLERVFIAGRDNPRFKVFHLGENGTAQLPDDLGNTLLIYSMLPTDKARPTFDEIEKMEGINPLFYHDIFGPEVALMEAFPAGADKASAVKRLARETGAENIVAFGDNLNDIPMLRAADVAVAVGNAVPEVKAVADIVIGRNTEDAVARTIRDITLRHSLQP